MFVETSVKNNHGVTDLLSIIAKNVAENCDTETGRAVADIVNSGTKKKCDC